MNDERPIEKLLRRYAQKRGDEAGPPPELHPATRRLLQGEVARQFPKPGAESKSTGASFFTLLAQRWVYAVGIFAVLCVAAVMILPTLTKPERRELLAQSSPSDEKARLESLPAPVAAPPAAPAEVNHEPQRALGAAGNLVVAQDESVRLDRYAVTNGIADMALAGIAEQKQDAAGTRKREESANTTLGARFNSSPSAATPKALQAPTRSAGEMAVGDTLTLSDTGRANRNADGTTTDNFANRRQAATTVPVAPTVSSLEFRADSDKKLLASDGAVEKDAERFYAQSFTRVVAEQLKTKAVKLTAAAPQTAVLVNFQIEQAGNRLRVIDGDGSMYLGEVNATSANYAFAGGGGKEQTANFFKSADQPATAASAKVGSIAKQPVVNYQWRVAGTNRTLNQNVVFTWTFVETNALAVSQLQSGSGQQPTFPTQLQNSLIYGHAQLGTSQEIEINAVPVKP